MENKFNMLQDEIMEYCIEIGKEINGNVYHDFIQEKEYAIERVLKIWIAAPCGCCKLEPMLNIGDKNVVSKLKLLKDVHDIIRHRISEFANMYGIDYSDQYHGNEDMLFSKSVKEVADDFCKHYIEKRKEYWDDKDIDEDDLDENGNIDYGVKDYSVEKYGC